MIAVKFVLRRAIVAGLLSCAVIASAPAHAGEHAGGERDYAAHCAVCHGLDARGGGPYADKLRRRPKDLTLLSAKNRGVYPEQLVHDVIDGRRLVVSHGTREMPVWRDAFRAQGDEASTRRRISALVAYSRFRQVPATPP